MNENLKTSEIVDFYGQDFMITPDVLTPRPETEQLIDEVLYLAGKPILPWVEVSENVLPENPVILDVGTGSGCIAITLKKLIPEAEVFASDISEKAIEVAQKNASRQNIPITTIIAHLLENVKCNPDLVVANLPYVDRNWDWVDEEALKSDPEIALYAEDGGLALIKELIDQAEERKIPRLVLEADPCQHDEIIDYASGMYELVRARGFILSFELL